jgi:hypothetical protein
MSNEQVEDVPQIGMYGEAPAEATEDTNRKGSDQEESYDQGFEDEEPVAVNANSEPVQGFEDEEPVAANANPEPAPEAASTPAVQLDAPTPTSTPAVELDEPTPANDIPEEAIGSNSPERAEPSRDSSPAKSPTGASKVSDDLKARTMFSMSTTDGVLKRTTFIHKISGYRSAPEISIASKSGSMFMRSTQGPSPGSYNLPDDEKSKFKTTARFSFGGGSRFGLAGSPSKLQPGPGAYNPKDPSLYVDTKVGFGTSIRNKGAPASQANPGPGAYENRSTVGGGMMFTARGRHPQSYMRSRSLPGPGAYSPLPGAYQTSPKCGFGTSTRGDFGGGSRGQPGPGTYDMQSWKCVGKDSAKFSATSRRRMHDLNSYVTPGPGTYNAHATSFGSPGAYSCRHVDEGYKLRNADANAESASTMRATH